MRQIRNGVVGLALAILAAIPSAYAGPFSDDFTRCVVSQTTERERAVLVRWMFAVLSAHPEVRAMSNITMAEKRNANEMMAKMMQNLIIRSCRTEAKKAIDHEGAVSLFSSFEILGKSAAQDLFRHPDVKKQFAGVLQHFDLNAFRDLVMQ